MHKKTNPISVEKRIDPEDRRFPDVVQYHIYIKNAGATFPLARINPLEAQVMHYLIKGVRGLEPTGEKLYLSVKSSQQAPIEEIVQGNNINVSLSLSESMAMMRSAKMPRRYEISATGHMISFVWR